MIDFGNFDLSRCSHFEKTALKTIEQHYEHGRLKNPPRDNDEVEELIARLQLKCSDSGQIDILPELVDNIMYEIHGPATEPQRVESPENLPVGWMTLEQSTKSQLPLYLHYSEIKSIIPIDEESASLISTPTDARKYIAMTPKAIFDAIDRAKQEEPSGHHATRLRIEKFEELIDELRRFPRWMHDARFVYVEGVGTWRMIGHESHDDPSHRTHLADIDIEEYAILLRTLFEFLEVDRKFPRFGERRER